MSKNDVARVNGVSAYYVEYVLDKLKPPIPSSLPSVICLDETFSQVAAESDEKTSWIKFVTNFSNGETGELLDILPFKNKARLIRYFTNNFSLDERNKVRHLCCDGADYYMDLADKCFPNADVCLDNFHITKRLQTGFYHVRAKQQDHLLSQSKEKNDSFFREATDLKRLAHKFITAANNHESYWGDKYNEYSSRIQHHLSVCPELKDAYAMLQYYYEIFQNCFDYKQRIKYLDIWIDIFGKSTSEAINATVKSVTSKLSYIHNAWKYGYSNATCEGNNNVIQTIKDVSYGIHSFDYFRTRALLIVGKPGVERSKEKKELLIPISNSFFFDDFPSLEEYVLAYDWSNPEKDFSLATHKVSNPHFKWGFNFGSSAA